MSADTLQQIQTLQFSDKNGAERLLLAFIRDTFQLDARAVELRPMAISLNSFNGFLTLEDGRRLFFKTHTEADTVINEYYHAELLSKAGYPVIQPIFRSIEVGKQLLIYERIDDPSVFDLAWEIESRRAEEGELDRLTQAQQRADEQLASIYHQTLEWQESDDAAQSAIHQLFYHRITGGRLERFYGPLSPASVNNHSIQLLDGAHSMDEARNVQWVINGQQYNITLNDLIRDCAQLLIPAQEGPSIIGHGDAHNGNVFLKGQGAEASLCYFDPAFAGRHHPLLDLAKPLFHNVFAMWMYFPEVKRRHLQISFRRRSDVWHVDYDYALHPARMMFLRSKVERALIPVLRELRQRGQLRLDWRAYLKAALFCCPFLTMNLADHTRFPPEISLLGLAMSIEMGAESGQQRSLIDATLDAVERELALL